MTTTVVLPQVPGLGGLFVRGAGLSAARHLRPGPSVLPSVDYVVHGVRTDADHLTSYQHLLGEPASDHLPAGFVHVLAFPVATALMARSDFPLPLVGLVHVANHVTQLRPIMVDEVLDVRASATDLRAHRAGTQVDLVVEVSTDGALAWRGVSTYLARGVFLAGTVEEESLSFVPPMPTGRWQLAADTGRRYGAVSGDRNPIHLSALSAKAFGFPRAIAHGMYTASRALADVGAGRGDAFEWSVEFVKPVLLPGTVTVRIARSDDGFVFAGWDARTGKPHLTGSVIPLP